MKVLMTIAIAALSVISCATHGIENKANEDLVFNELTTNYRLTDVNDDGCEQINASVLEHIFQFGTLITMGEANDHYSSTGCSIKGTIAVNGAKVDFTHDYGGIIYFSNGMILGCGQGCCAEDYPYCSWDAHELRAF